MLFFAHLVVFCTSCCLLHILLSFAHLIVFCTSYCFLHILLFCTFFYFIAHFTLISPFLTICMPLCYVTLYNLYSYYFALSTERTWFDYISLLIIPCITIMWQIKKPWPWQATGMTASLNTIKQSRFKHLGELHKEWSVAGVSASRVTTLRRLQKKGYQATSETETTPEASYLG